MATLESTKAHVILLGRFDPDDALPEKLKGQETLTAAEANAAVVVSLMRGQIVELDLGWGHLHVVQQRLWVQTPRAPYVRAADLALKIVKDSSKSAVTMFGINSEYEYKFESVRARDLFGMKLSPPDAWGDWGTTIAQQNEADKDFTQHGGLLSITSRRKQLDDREDGWIDVTVSASGAAPSEPRVTIVINDHYQFSTENDPEELSGDSHAASRTSRLLDTLFANFDNSIKRSRAIAQSILPT